MTPVFGDFSSFFSGDPQCDPMGSITFVPSSSPPPEQPPLLSSKALITAAIGKENLKLLKFVSDEDINRFSLYASIKDRDFPAYFKMFQNLNPSKIWLQNDANKRGVSEVAKIITQNGGYEAVGPYLLWAQSPGKIYCAYPTQDQKAFVMERFLLNAEQTISCLGFTKVITSEELHEQLNRHLKTTHCVEWWSNPEKMFDNSRLEPLIQTIERTEAIRERIIGLEKELEAIPTNDADERIKKAAQCSDEQIDIRREERQYIAHLKKLGLQVVEMKKDPSGVKQRHAFKKIGLNIAALDKDEIESRQRLDKEYASAFDALI